MQVSTEPELWLAAVSGVDGVAITIRTHGDQLLADSLKAVPTRLRPLIGIQLLVVVGSRWLLRKVRGRGSLRHPFLGATVTTSDWPLLVAASFQMVVRYTGDELPNQVQLQCHEVAQVSNGTWVEHLVAEIPVSVEKASKGEMYLHVTVPDEAPPSFWLTKTAIRWTLQIGAFDPKVFPIWVCSS